MPFRCSPLAKCQLMLRDLRPAARGCTVCSRDADPIMGRVELKRHARSGVPLCTGTSSRRKIPLQSSAGDLKLKPRCRALRSRSIPPAHSARAMQLVGTVVPWCATCPFDMPRSRNQLELLLSKAAFLDTVFVFSQTDTARNGHSAQRRQN